MRIDTILRKKDMISGAEDLEPLYTMREFPIYMGVTDQRIEDDAVADEKWMISKGSGMIQLQELVPAEILYSKSHNASIGKVWQRHHTQFADFLHRQGIRGVLEVGGGNGILNATYNAQYCGGGYRTWHIIEPSHVEPLPGCNAEYVHTFWKAPFDFGTVADYDVLVHSHLMEHQFDLHEFMTLNRSALKPGMKMVFSVPNMTELLIRKYPYALNFEHTYFISEDYIELILQEYGFRLLEKQYFEDHSIFFSTELESAESSNPFLNQTAMNALYVKNKKLFNDYIEYYQEKVEQLNRKIEASQSNVFIFGAHINTQLLINFGLRTEKIQCALDNDSNKQGHRLYGTSLMIRSPHILSEEDHPLVILIMGAYSKEIKEDILDNINKEVLFVN